MKDSKVTNEGRDRLLRRPCSSAWGLCIKEGFSKAVSGIRYSVLSPQTQVKGSSRSARLGRHAGKCLLWVVGCQHRGSGGAEGGWGGSLEEQEQRVIPSTRVAAVAGQWHVGG